MKYILTAMMNVADGKYDEAEKSFKEAGKIVEMDTEKKFFSYILYVQEMAKYYDLIGKIVTIHLNDESGTMPSSLDLEVVGL